MRTRRVGRGWRWGARQRIAASAGGGRENRWVHPPVAPTAPAVSSSVAAAAVVVGGAAGCRRGGGGRSGGCAYQWQRPRPPSTRQSLRPLWWLAARPGVGGGGAGEAEGAPTSGTNRARRLLVSRCRRCGGRRRGRVSVGGGREKRWVRLPVATAAPAVSSAVAAAVPRLMPPPPRGPPTTPAYSSIPPWRVCSPGRPRLIDYSRVQLDTPMARVLPRSPASHRPLPRTARDPHGACAPPVARVSTRSHPRPLDNQLPPRIATRGCCQVVRWARCVRPCRPWGIGVGGWRMVRAAAGDGCTNNSNGHKLFQSRGR